MKSQQLQLMPTVLMSAILLAVISPTQAIGTEESPGSQLTIELKDQGAAKPVSGVELTVSTNYDETFAKQATGEDGRAIVSLPKAELQDLWVRTSLTGWVPMTLSW